MAFKVIADSSNDVDLEMVERYQLQDLKLVPFKLYIGENTYVDDSLLDVGDFIKKMGASAVVPRTACPSPADFLECFVADQDNYVVTISSELSGTYNSAVLAKNLFLESNPDAFVHVFDSKSASVGESLISIQIFKRAQSGMPREQIVEEVEAYITTMKTRFIAESLDNLIKNGRISRLKGVIANALRIKPIMAANEKGEIVMLEKERGSERAFNRLVEIVLEETNSVENGILGISHVENPERAEKLKKQLLEKRNFEDIIIVQTRGLSSLYCDQQGVIISY